MTGKTARVTFIGPSRLMASCCSTCSAVISSKKPLNERPALLTSTSIRPKRSAAASAAPLASSARVTSSPATSRSAAVPASVATVCGSRPVATT
jgi:hypothetical protein